MHRNVYRTESEHSEDSSTKRVSFNKDINVKRIPRGAVVDKQGHLLGYLPEGDNRRVVYNVYKEPPQYDEDYLAKEAERILQQVQGADCIVTGAPVIFDTRSLDRPKKKKNNQDQGNNWSKTLPSTKNKLDSKPKKKELFEKNNKLNAIKSKLLRSNSASGEKLDTILETSKETLNNSYLKESLRFSDKNMPVKNSNEQIFQRRQHSSEYIDRMPPKLDSLPKRRVDTDRFSSPPRSYRYSEDQGSDNGPRNPVTNRQLSYTRNETDPLHSMPGGVIEPIYSIGFTHNRNRPFSYTGGSSPQVNLQSPALKYGEDDSFKHHYEDDRNIYHSTQKVMEKDSIMGRDKASQQFQAHMPTKDNTLRPSAVGRVPNRADQRRDSYTQQSNKLTTTREPSPPVRSRDGQLPNKYVAPLKEPATGYTTKIMINVDKKIPDGRTKARNGTQLNSTKLVRDASDTSQTIGIQSTRLVRQASAVEPPPRPLRAKEKRFETSVAENQQLTLNRSTDVNQSKLAQRTSTIGRVPSQREPENRDKKRKVKIVFEYKKAPEDERDPLSRFVEYKGSDLQFARPVFREHEMSSSRQATLERRKKKDESEDAIRRHRSEQRYAEEALLEYERRARSLSPDKVPAGSHEDPEREERIRRQRDKFLTAIFGPGKIPGVMSDENIPNVESPEPKYEDERRRVLSNPDISTIEGKRRTHASVSPERASQERTKSYGVEQPRRSVRYSDDYRLSDQHDRREGFGKNRSPDRMETSESDETNNRAAIRRSRADLGSVTPPTPEYDSSSYSSTSKNGDYQRKERVGYHNSSRSENPAWIVTVQPTRDYLERRNSDFSESERDYRREMATRKALEDEPDNVNGNWTSLTLNRLEAKNKKNRNLPAAKTLERSETLRNSRHYLASEVVDNKVSGGFNQREERKEQYPTERLRKGSDGIAQEEKENRKNLRYFGDTDLESEKNGKPYKSALKNDSTIKRTMSSVSTAKEPKMDYLKPPKLIPNSLSSSLNSSESEAGEAGSQAASGSSQRSVYLHATTVADIPVTGMVQRRRDDSSEREGYPQLAHPVAQAHGAQLKSARNVSRSFSVLTPWKPRHYREKFEINYSNRQGPQPPVTSTGPLGKPPRPPRKREVDEDETVAPSQMSVGRPVKAQPKEAKSSGWFKRKKRIT